METKTVRAKEPNFLQTVSQWQTNIDKTGPERSERLLAIDEALRKYHEAKGQKGNYQARYKLSGALIDKISEWKKHKEDTGKRTSKRAYAVSELIKSAERELTWLKSVNDVLDNYGKQRKIVVKDGEQFLLYTDTNAIFNDLKDSFTDISEVSLMVAFDQLMSQCLEVDSVEVIKEAVLDTVKNSKSRNLSDSPDLWMKAGQLNSLQGSMGEQIQIWDILSKELTEYCAANEKILKSGLLECGKLIIRSGAKPELIESQDVPDALSQKLKAFLLNFMNGSGQLAYIDSKDWFKNNEYYAAVEINFYPNREFDENSGFLGVHKDTDSRNLFVNLIFNNETNMPATEWTWDEVEPDSKRMQELRKFLPKEEVEAIMDTKRKIGNINIDEPGRSNWEGGAIAQNGYVSWVDELTWHSTPSIEKRSSFDIKDNNLLVNVLFNNEDIMNTDQAAILYDIMKIIAPSSKYKDWLGKVLVDISSWEKAFATICKASKDPKAPPHVQGFKQLISNEINSFDWNTCGIDLSLVSALFNDPNAMNTGRAMFLYEAMQIVMKDGSPLEGYRDFFLADMEIWKAQFAKIHKASIDPKAPKDWQEMKKTIAEEIANIDWSKHKYTGLAGNVEVRDVNGDLEPSRRVPTKIGERTRSNSLDDVQLKNKQALSEMKVANGGNLPLRSFIRTWVTLVKS